MSTAEWTDSEGNLWSIEFKRTWDRHRGEAILRRGDAPPLRLTAESLHWLKGVTENWGAVIVCREHGWPSEAGKCECAKIRDAK